MDVGKDAATTACRSAMARLGWEVSSESGGHLDAREDPTRLSCRTTPSALDLEIESPSPNRTVVSLTIKAPGFGRIPAGRAERQLAALTRRISKPA
jgi:hypothetical protein